MTWGGIFLILSAAIFFLLGFELWTPNQGNWVDIALGFLVVGILLSGLPIPNFWRRPPAP